VIARASRPPSLTVRAIDDPHWLAFLQSQPDATVFHHPAWTRVLAETYGFRPLLSVHADDDGTIAAGLPLLELGGSLRGRNFASLPYTDYCPPLATSPSSLTRLTSELVEWRQRQNARQLAVHAPLPTMPGVHRVSFAVRHVLPLGCTSEQLLTSLKGSALPRAIRKAKREGVEAELSHASEDLDTFYALHLQTRRRLGVPVQPRRFLEILWKQVIRAGLGFVVLARLRGRPIAGALFLAWNGNLIYKFGASDQRYWELRPNNLVIWTALEWACEAGYRRLDLGRTDFENQGLRDFKRRWGAVELPLVYSYVASRPPGSLPRVLTRGVARLIQSSPPIVCRAMGELLYGRVPGFA
jgi:CelD/BcsL family acetyltransferase involved in cellulose biosynthesis